jgi:Uma2 family endonuclease
MQGLGTVVTEMSFVLDPGQNLRWRPDVAFVSARQWPLNRELPESGDWDVVPDLAVEVVSPTDEFSDVVAKVREYFEYGVRRVWVILPEERQVYVYESPTQVRILAADETLLGEDLFPGFTLPLPRLFAHAATSQSP